MKLFLPTTAFIILNILCAKAYCQKTNQIGINFQLEETPIQAESINPGVTKATHNNLNLGFGAMYEVAYNKHSSTEIGLKYRHAINSLKVAIATAPGNIDFLHFDVIENYISLPILYKYNTRIFTISAGPSLDYFLSWNQQKETPYDATLPSYKPFMDKNLSLGLLMSLSKTIKVEKKIAVEPSIYYNPVLSYKRTYYGISVTTKYVL
jgi:hypothetical protein